MSAIVKLAPGAVRGVLYAVKLDTANDWETETA